MLMSRLFNLCQVLNLQHVVVGVSSQNSSSLTGHVYVIIIDRLAADWHPPGHAHRWISITFLPSAARCSPQTEIFYISKNTTTKSNIYRYFHALETETHHSRGFPEEVVLTEDGDEEADKAFNRHGNESPSHNIPLKRRLHLVKLA